MQPSEHTSKEVTCVCDKSKFRQPIKQQKIIFFVSMISIVIFFTIFFLQMPKTTEISVQMCQIEKNSATTCDINNKPTRNYGRILVGNNVWFCGGHASNTDMNYDQMSCVLLNILDIEMKSLEYKLKG